MPTPTYTPLANLTLGSSASSVTFSSISQSYRDLVLVVNGIIPANSDLRLIFNDNNSATTPWMWAKGNGGAATSGSASSSQGHFLIQGDGNSGSTWSAIINFMDYSVGDKDTTVLSRFNNTDGNNNMLVTRWVGGDAVTSFKITPYTYGFSAGSSFALYGIAA